MSFGQNLQGLRKMRNKMTQEELAENLGVSRQTVSKWELDMGYPEMDKVIELCNFFSCTMDELIRGDLNVSSDAYTDIHMETVKAFNYVKYAVISRNSEMDAINHVKEWGKELGMSECEIIGWDYPYLSQEQINVFHMNGYEAAIVVKDEAVSNIKEQPEVIHQEEQVYITISIRKPMSEPWRLIPNAYKSLMTHMKINGIKQKRDKKILECFEKEYVKDGIEYMGIYLAVE